MKNFKKLIKKLSHVPVVGELIFTLSKIPGLTPIKERIIKIRKERLFFQSVHFTKTVIRGPFKGLTYPTLESTCSEIAPKIIGSYESELFPAIEEILRQDYDVALDIGCAEGFYAVGLALKMPKLQMYAFDINQEAIKMCRRLAETNHVEKRVHLRGLCDSDTLASFDFRKKGLIICDCEGYELQLFNEKNIHNLRNVDLLIELHDIIIPGLSEKLLPVFANTHSLQIIKTQHRDTSRFPELKNFKEEDGQIILSEFREGLFGKGTMDWAYLKSLS